MGLLYTIGHSRHEFAYFANLLKKYEINYLLDVRSVPYSRYAETYNREQLESLLTVQGVKYAFMGKFFGARPDNTALYNEEGYLDFARVIKSEIFIQGMENVKKGLKKGNNIVLMCTEKDPIDCHRAIMVARAFALQGIAAGHILPNGKLQTQQELDERLLDKYFSDRAQISLFDYDNARIDENRIIQAYRARNKDIGYRLQNKEKTAI